LEFLERDLDAEYQTDEAIDIVLIEPVVLEICKEIVQSAKLLKCTLHGAGLYIW
jgi:hypothetical protein